MRLYSFHQLAAAIGGAALLFFTVGILAGGQLFSGTTAPQGSDSEPAAAVSTYDLQTIPVQAVPGLDAGEYTPEEGQTIRIYETLNEGVVNITTEVVNYNWFLEPIPQSGGSGSGSIIDARGYVLTNNHVIEGAVKVFVNLADGTQFEGQVVGVDPENDLAVVKFDPAGRPLITVPFGTSQGLKVGQKVLAIGNPFGLTRTMTTGIVSALGRPLQNEKGLIIQDMIQTDASINPGNSGGPLINAKGQMVGINTMIFSPSGGSVGIGFAIPVDTARRVVPDLIQFGQVKRGWIDMVPVQIFPALVKAARLPVQKGLLISRVQEGGNAQKAGLKGGSRSQAIRYGRTVIYLGGDIITAVDDKPVESLADLYGALESSKPGQTVTITYYRGRDRQTLRLTLSERPKNYEWE